MTTHEDDNGARAAELCRAFLDAQLAGDRRRGLRVLLDQGLRAGLTVPDLHLGVIQAAQYEIGRLWEANVVSVAQEHVATAIAQLALSHLYGQLPRAPSVGRSAMVACVEGDLHEMGPRIVSDFLEMSGFDVRYVGANVPTDSLVERVRVERPHLVALSASMSYHLPAMLRAVESLREAAPDVVIGVGGFAFAGDPDAATRAGARVSGRDARAMVDSARAALGIAS